MNKKKAEAKAKAKVETNKSFKIKKIVLNNLPVLKPCRQG